MEINNSILKVLVDSGKPMKAGEIAEKTGTDKKNIDKYLKNLVKEGKIFSPSRCYYDLKNK